MLVKGPQECAILYQIRLCYTKPDCTSICYEKWNNASSHMVHNMLYIYVKLLISAHDPDVSHKNTNFHFNLTNFNPTSIMFSKVLRDTDNTCPGTQSIYLEVTFNTSRPRQNGRHFSDNISNAFSSMKMFGFWSKFHWSLFPGVQLTKFQHWFRSWLGAEQATSHCLNQWWSVYWCIYTSLGLGELKQAYLVKLAWFLGH